MARKWMWVLVASMASSCTPRGGAPPDEPGPAEPVAPKGASERDAPEISRSVGNPDGLVVLWPRVIPKSDDPALAALAGTLQQRVAELGQKAAPARGQDVRPAPERVCPREGCAAPAVGALLVHAGGGCVALALVSEPGTSSTRIVPWAGEVKLERTSVPFREPPESEVTLVDAVACDQLAEALAAREADVVKAFGEVAR